MSTTTALSPTSATPQDEAMSLLHWLQLLDSRIRELTREVEENNAVGTSPLHRAASRPSSAPSSVVHTSQDHLEPFDDDLPQNQQSEQVVAPLPAAPQHRSRETMPRELAAIEVCHYAAQGDTRRLEALLQRYNLDPNHRDYDSNTPLHVAAMRGQTEAGRVLLAWGADTTLTDSSGKTALDIALELGNDEFVDLIQDHRAKHLLDGADDRAPTSGNGESATLDSFDRAILGDTLPEICGQSVGDETPQSSLLGNVHTAPHPPHIIILVGLPARGKSYVSRRIVRYWRWRGVPCQTFHYGSTRRKLCGPYDRTNEGRVEDLDVTAKVLAEDAVSFARTAGGIAVIDGTNTTQQRRALLREKLQELGMHPKRVIFVEIVRDDPTIIQANIARSYEAKLAKGDIDDSADSRRKYIEDYNHVIRQYEKYSRTLSVATDPELSFIRIENHVYVTIHRIEGLIGTRLVSLMHNLWFEPHSLYLTVCGEWEDLVAGRLGGNSKLTAYGRAYAERLANFFDTERLDQSSTGEKTLRPLLIMSSAQERARETCAPLAAREGVVVRYLPNLDDLSYGDCDGQTLAEVNVTLPNTLRGILDNPYKNAWPNGESVEQLFEGRLEQYTLELQAMDRDVLVVAHRNIIQGLLLYFDDSMDLNPETAIGLDVPLHHLFKLAPSGSARKLTTIDLSCGQTAVSSTVVEPDFTTCK